MQFNIRKLESTASTNDDAKQAAETGAAEGAVIWALQQSAGRGRQGRQWQSPVGNLYVSLLLRPQTDQKQYGFYSFIAALAISDAIRNFLPQAMIELKWPNDVLVEGKKISGILLEAGDGYLVVGMGVNIRHTPENPLYPATCLAEHVRQLPSIEGVLNSILQAFAKWCGVYGKQGFAAIRIAWLLRARKGALRVRQADGDIHGEFADLDSDGHLHLVLPNGSKRSFNTGDVFF